MAPVAKTQSKVWRMTAKIDPPTLQLFVAIVEEQSIAKAAEKKNIAASAVIRRHL